MSEASTETQRRFADVAEALASERKISVGQTGKKGFGSSALQVNGKIFAMVSSAGAFVVKLPRRRVEELEATGVGQKFDPGHGRLMKEWLEVHQVHLPTWRSLALEALSFVRG